MALVTCNLSFAATFSTAVAVVNNTEGKVGQTIPVHAQYHYTVVNSTREEQTYFLEETIKTSDGQKTVNKYSFWLGPYGKYTHTDYQNLNYKATKAGTIKTEARIYIGGYDGVGHLAVGKVTVK